MKEKLSSEELCRKILEDNGGFIADKARKILLEEPALKNLQVPLEFISKTWRDLTPALTSLSCESVGGKKEATYDVSLAVCLMHLSFYLWDDMIDNARSKLFKPTFFGKFGANTSLIVGGLASAKAYSILNEMSMEKEKRQMVTKVIWDLWTRMAKAETANANSRTKTNKLWKIKTEAADMVTCLKLGAIVGNGSKIEIQHLGNYGFCFGVILALRNDFHVSANLTLELAEKIENGKLPYTLLWACNHSKKLQGKIETLVGRKAIEQMNLKEIVEEILATEAYDRTRKNIEMYAKKARDELYFLKINNATQTLESIIGLQPKLFIESFSIYRT